MTIFVITKRIALEDYDPNISFAMFLQEQKIYRDLKMRLRDGFEEIDFYIECEKEDLTYLGLVRNDEILQIREAPGIWNLIKYSRPWKK